MHSECCILPQIILLDTSDSPHLADFGSCSNNLYSYMRSGFDDGIFVVCELGGRRVGIPLDIAGNQLEGVLAGACAQKERTASVHEPRQRVAGDQPGQRSPGG